MSKRKNKPTKTTAPQAAQPVRPPRSTPAPAPRAQPAPRRWPLWQMGLAALFVVVVGGLYYLWWRAYQPKTTQSTVAPALTVKWTVGRTDACKRKPAFANGIGFTQNVGMKTDIEPQKGVLLVELDDQGRPGRSYQHPSWTQGGYLGPTVTDKFGSTYLFPIPWVNVLENPTAKQNIVYKIDTQTGVMGELINLPAGGPLDARNPFGLVGLAYDCDTNSLYASSVAGSTPDQEAGRLFQIDPTTAKIVSQRDKIDTFGSVVFNTAKGKRLYFGMARTSEVRSILLDDNGHFVGEPRAEFSLAGMGVHGDEKAQRLTIDANNILHVRSLQFDFNLIAPSHQRRTLFDYSYDMNKDAWQLIKVTPIN